MNKPEYIVVLLLMYFAASSSASAQDEFSKHNEINIVIDNIFSKYPDNSFLATGNYSALTNLSLPQAGIGYKFNFTNGAIRNKINFQTFSREYHNSDVVTTKTFSLFTIGFSTGYEYHINVDKTQFFIGAEAFVSYTKTTSAPTSYYGGYSYSTKVQIMEFLSVGVAPLAGIKYFISPSFSVSTEFRLMAHYYALDHPSSAKEKGHEIVFGPLGQISFNVHF